MDEQLRTDWPSTLDGIARRLNPIHEKMLAFYHEDYYWSVPQSEWATDILFKSSALWQDLPESGAQHHIYF